MSLLGELTYALIQPSSRSIATIVPDVVVREVHRDELIITQHPVEKGATITDHAFKRPSEVEMFCGFSNSTAGYEGYTLDIYQSLVGIQSARQPFSVSTGKRRYRNMLIRTLSVETDPHSENALMVVVGLQEIIIVSTQTTGTGTDTTQAAGSTSDQASPETTGSTTDRGDQTGVGTGADSFAGSFNPGGFNTDGGTLGNAGFGLDGISTGPIGEVGPIQIDAIDGVPVNEGSSTIPTAPYNIFEFG